MDKAEKRMSKKIEELDSESVVKLLQQWEMTEFIEFVRERQIDGRKLMGVTEGIVKLWRPKVNAKKFISFIEDLKLHPKKYIQSLKENKDAKTDIAIESIECQYQTVKKVRESSSTSTSINTVEELLKKIVPAKSFLYRNQAKKNDKTIPSYLPMDAGTPKKPRKFFRLSSYEYPSFDLRRFSRQESSSDRGYYSMKTNTRYYIQKTHQKPDARPKYKSLASAEELSEKYPEDHFYEDLCYNDVEEEKDIKRHPSVNNAVNVKPCIVKIQELFQSFRIPFLKKVDEPIEDRRIEVKEKEINLYENSDNVANMYDSIHVNSQTKEVNGKEKDQEKLPVEDYLEPVQLNKDYCDVNYREKDDSLLGYILSIFENRFGIWRETNDADQSEGSEGESKAVCTPDECPGRKWTEDRKSGRTNMADRPLPVPVENEPYYMNIDRGEAENLLRGQPDGTFILRPSSQPNHAYTLTVSCANSVHNVGVRRRPDGRLALGFQRRGERSFTSVTSLLRHHRRRRLLLVAAGGVIGGTTLNETPHYYQTPSNLPVPV